MSPPLPGVPVVWRSCVLAVGPGVVSWRRVPAVGPGGCPGGCAGVVGCGVAMPLPPWHWISPRPPWRIRIRHVARIRIRLAQSGCRWDLPPRLRCRPGKCEHKRQHAQQQHVAVKIGSSGTNHKIVILLSVNLGTSLGINTFMSPICLISTRFVFPFPLSSRRRSCRPKASYYSVPKSSWVGAGGFVLDCAGCCVMICCDMFGRRASMCCVSPPQLGVVQSQLCHDSTGQKL